MDIVLWVLQILLGVMFVFHGAMMFKPPANLPPNMAYVREISSGLRNFTAITEVLAGLGIILPWLTQIAPILTPLAGVGIVVLMLGAAVLHIQRKENAAIPINLFIAALAAFVAYSRFTELPPL